MLPTGFSTSHVVLVLAIALIVVGPKDLPKLLRQVGQFVGRMRSMAADFRTSFEDMARQSELEDLRKEVEAMRASTTQAVEETTAQISQAAGFENDPMHDLYDPMGLKLYETAEPSVEAEAAPAKPKRGRKKAAVAEIVSEPVAVDSPKPVRRRKPPAGGIVT